jgi:hypothetical protein
MALTSRTPVIEGKVEDSDASSGTIYDCYNGVACAVRNRGLYRHFPGERKIEVLALPCSPRSIVALDAAGPSIVTKRGDIWLFHHGARRWIRSANLFGRRVKPMTGRR